MRDHQVLVCGATGFVGARIVRGLVEAKSPTRALVRPSTDASSLEHQSVEIVRGDLRDSASLQAAVAGVSTIISTLQVLTRLLQGDRTLSFRDVELEGYAALIAAAERAGVERFVYFSSGDAALATDSPFGSAKRATEARLHESRLRDVIIRPEMNQELWFSAPLGFDLEHGKIQIFGRGRTRINYVAEDDVAAAAVALALAPDPPPIVRLGGPEGLSRVEAADMLSAAIDRPMARRHVPRVVLKAAARILRRSRPGVASLMAMGLAMDAADSKFGPEAFAALGVTPRPISTYLKQRAEEAGAAPAR